MKNRFSITNGFNIYDWEEDKIIEFKDSIKLLNQLNNDLENLKIKNIDKELVTKNFNVIIYYCNYQIQQILEDENHPHYIVKYDIAKKLLKSLAKNLDIELNDNCRYRNYGYAQTFTKNCIQDISLFKWNKEEKE